MFDEMMGFEGDAFRFKEKITNNEAWISSHQFGVSFSYSRMTTELMFEIFIGIFGVGLMGMCLYWVLGDGKRKQQIIANMLIYLWGFMLFGLAIGVVNSLFQWRKVLQPANDTTFFTSQKLTLLAHGIAARQSQIAFSARKFDGEIDGKVEK